mgnify:CR=1 FL=1
MRITEMNAKDGERKVRIFVSPMMLNKDCDDFRPHLGWWYCIKGGVMGMFSLKRPHSGIQLQGKCLEITDAANPIISLSYPDLLGARVTDDGVLISREDSGGLITCVLP